MCSSSKGCVWGWIAALSVLAGVLLFPAAAILNIPTAFQRNVAKGKNCSQSSNRDETQFQNGYCDRALNGLTTEPYKDNIKSSNCQHTNENARENWWTVNLGPNIYIHKIIIYSRSDAMPRMPNIVIYLDGETYTKITDEKPDYRFDFDPSKKVQHIKLTRKGDYSDAALINICELEAYACKEDRWGENCDKQCATECKNGEVKCDRKTGHCIECQSNRWGRETCNNVCYEGCKPRDVTCVRTTGVCIECKNNTLWGEYCNSSCPEGCKDGTVNCNRTTGVCIECKNNTLWGEYCNSSCPEGCKDGTVNCNRTTGVCIECIDGKWGNNCSDACGEGCNETNCHMNGTCHCRSHWMPPNCDVCNPGKWGEDCLNDCGEGCKDGVCNKTNGHCNCTSAELIAPLCGGCNPGKWGKNCENDCGVGCEGETCKKDDGSCECQPGWVGTKCDGRPCECGEYECTTSGKYIFADVPRKVNVAIGKPSKASTIKKEDNDDSAVRSCLANDGYLSTSELTTCMSTAEGDPAPFWELDLGEKYEIAGINIDFDDDDKMKRSGISILLDGKEIFVTNDQTTDPAYIPNNRRRNWIGQVLKLQRKGRRIDPLMICEVEVFNCMPGFYGYECEGICERPVCDNGKFCSRIDGSCKETVEVKETTDCSPLILVAGYVVGFLIISLFIFAAKVIPYKKKSKPTAVKKEAEGDKEEEKTEGEGSGIGGDKVEESGAEIGETSETKEKESQV